MKPKDGQIVDTGPNASEMDKRAVRTLEHQRTHPPVGDALRPELQVAMLAAADRLMNEGLEPIAALRELTNLLGGNFDYKGRMLHNHTAAEDAVFQLLMCLHATLDQPVGPN